MLYCIVPLAGPDFTSPAYGVKPLYKIDGRPLIEKALESRCWYRQGELKSDGLIFVLRETPETPGFTAYLKDTFSGCKTVLLPELTGGALLSALAGTSIIKDYARPVAVDLVDILYDAGFSPLGLFNGDGSLGGILPYFDSANEKYSYLVIEDGYVKQTAEKKVISRNASAGTYFFRDLGVFLNAAWDSVLNEGLYHYKNSLFLCPAFNGVVKNGKKVLGVPVKNQNELSLMFKDIQK